MGTKLHIYGSYRLGPKYIGDFVFFLGFVTLVNYPLGYGSQFPYRVITIFEIVWILFPVLGVLLNSRFREITVFQYEFLEFISGLFPVALMVFFALLKTIPLHFPDHTREVTFLQVVFVISAFIAMSQKNSRILENSIKGLARTSGKTWLIDHWSKLKDERNAKDKNSVRLLQLILTITPIFYALIINFARQSNYSNSPILRFFLLQLFLMILVIGSTEAFARLLVSRKLQWVAKE